MNLLPAIQDACMRAVGCVLSAVAFREMTLSNFTSRLFSVALLSPAGNGLTSWHLFVMFSCVYVTFSCGILGQVWYLIVSIPDLAVFLTFVRMKFASLESNLGRVRVGAF